MAVGRLNSTCTGSFDNSLRPFFKTNGMEDTEQPKMKRIKAVKDYQDSFFIIPAGTILEKAPADNQYKYRRGDYYDRLNLHYTVAEQLTEWFEPVSEMEFSRNDMMNFGFYCCRNAEKIQQFSIAEVIDKWIENDKSPFL